MPPDKLQSHKALLKLWVGTLLKAITLEDLLGLLRPHHPSLFALRRGLLFLSRFAVDTRYPGFHARRSQADASRRGAGQVRSAARTILGLRPPRPKRKKPP